MNDAQDLYRLFRPLFKGWWVLLLFCSYGMYRGWNKARQIPPMYEARSTIQINDQKSEISRYLEDLEPFAIAAHYADQLALLRSNYLVWKAIWPLNLETTYYRMIQGNPRMMYPETLFEINYELDNPDLKDRWFYLEVAENGILQLRYPSGEETTVEIQAEITQSIRGPGFVIQLFPKQPGEGIPAGEYAFRIHTKEGLIEEFGNIDDYFVRLQNEKTPYINLYTWHENPQLAVDIANRMAEAYMTDQLQQKLDMALQALHNVDSVLLDHERIMRRAEQALAGFKLTHSKTSSIKQVREWRKRQLELTSMVLSFDERRRRTLDWVSESGTIGPFETIRDQLFLSQYTNRTLTLRQLTSARQELDAPHPNWLLLEGRQDRLSRELTSRLTETLEVQEAQMADIERELTALREQQASFHEDNQEIQRMLRRLRNLLIVYQQLLAKRSEAVLSAAADLHYHRILEHAILPHQPLKPNPRIRIGVTGLYWTWLGIFFLILLRNAPGLLRKDSLMEKRWPGPIFREILSPTPTQRSLGPVSYNLGTELLLHPEQSIIGLLRYQSGPYPLLITQEMGRAIQDLGRTCLVVNLDPAVEFEEFFQLDSEKGLYQCLNQPAHSRQWVQYSLWEGMDVLPMGLPTDLPPTLVYAHARLPELLSTFQRQYDYLLLLLPPMRSFQEMRRMVALSHRNLLLSQVNYSQLNSIKHAHQLLQSWQASPTELLRIEQEITQGLWSHPLIRRVLQSLQHA
ncbi:MAG: hypothetical protein AAF399_13200 [Bacteroidota bacterium]